MLMILTACTHDKVAEALSKVKEHKKAVEQAEKIEQEFVSLMTGQKQSRKEKTDMAAHASGMTRHASSPATLMMVQQQS